MRRRVTLVGGGIAALLLAAFGLTRGLERIMRPAPAEPRQDGAPRPAPATPLRHITATLFYGSSDGQHLVPIKREVPFGEGPVEQGRQIVIAQLQVPPAAPLLSPIPQGATMRGFYVTDRGEAFVDLGPEVVLAHPGGSMAELFTVYTIVNAVTANLPAITRVQILIDGREAETLAGHVDLRRPLRRNESLVREGTH